MKSGGQITTLADCVLSTSDVTVMTSFSQKNNVFHKLNFVQNVYFGFFIFWKLTEWRCFVAYLWNDPCTTHLRLTLVKN